MAKNKQLKDINTYQYDMIPRIDPTPNVLKLVEEATKRINDLFDAHIDSTKELRISESKLRDYQILSIKEIDRIYENHAKELRDTEKGRLDSIRQVDQVNATNTAASLALAIQTLSSTAITNADNLRNALNTTATTMQKTTADLATTIAVQQGIRDENTNKRITTLEQSSYMGQGKEKVTDPMMEKYMSTMDAIVTKLAESRGKEDVTEPIATQALIDIKTLLSTRSENVGKKLGIGEVIGYILAAVAIGGFVGKFL